jgi:hypothetical protein
MHGDKNWILQKDVNANRFFWNSHWLEIWKKTITICPSMGPNGGSVAMDSGDLKCREVKTGFCRKRLMQTGSSETLIGWNLEKTLRRWT